MIEIKNIKKSYSNLQVLKGINLIIPEKKRRNMVWSGKHSLLFPE